MSSYSGSSYVVEKLLSEIASSAFAALKEYKASGQDLPPSSSTLPHPLDSASDNLALKKALYSVNYACHKLCTTLATPTHAIGESMMLGTEPTCMRVAIEARIADILLGAQTGLPIEEISKQTPNLDSAKLLRTIKFLITRGYFQEVSTGVFANNRLSLGLLSTNNLSAAAGWWTDDYMKGNAIFYETLIDPESAFSYAPSKSALVKALKGDAPEADLFTLYSNPVHSGRRERFGNAMLGWTKITGSVAAIRYPLWSILPPESKVCDVGSGIGAFSLRLARTYPHLNITLSDLPEAMDQAKNHWGTEFPEAIEQARVSFVPIDFLREVPKGADVYYIRHIMHDWPDDEVKRILLSVRKAMHSESKMLIHEFIIPEEDGLGQDFEPAATRILNLDMTLLSSLNGMERTRRHYVSLCAEVGLKMVSTYNLVETSILEFHIEPRLQHEKLHSRISI